MREPAFVDTTGLAGRNAHMLPDARRPGPRLLSTASRLPQTATTLQLPTRFRIRLGTRELHIKRANRSRTPSGAPRPLCATARTDGERPQDRGGHPEMSRLRLTAVTADWCDRADHGGRARRPPAGPEARIPQTANPSERTERRNVRALRSEHMWRGRPSWPA